MARRPPGRTSSARQANHSPRGETQLRQRLCAEAARILAEDGVKDYLAAKRKAALRLGLPTTTPLPTNREVDHALSEHLQLFHGARTAETLQQLRQVALEAMEFLAPFKPLLTGPVLSGTVTPQSEIHLHVTAETPEEIAWYLQEHAIPYTEADRRLRFGSGQAQVPTYRVLADTVPVEIYVFSAIDAREAPLSPLTGRPMERLSREALRDYIKDKV